MTADTGNESQGSPIVEEAAKLAAAVRDWMQSRGLGAVTATSVLTMLSEAVSSHLGGSEECTLCPVCQLIGLLRGAQPDVFEHLTEAAGSLSAAVTALLESSSAQRSSGPPPVEHIEVA